MQSKAKCTRRMYCDLTVICVFIASVSFCIQINLRMCCSVHRFLFCTFSPTPRIHLSLVLDCISLAIFFCFRSIDSLSCNACTIILSVIVNYIPWVSVCCLISSWYVCVCVCICLLLSHFFLPSSRLQTLY